MTLRARDTAQGYLVYENSSTRQRVRVSKDDLEAISEVCAMCAANGGALRRVEEGHYGYATLRQALGELYGVRDAIRDQGIPIDPDDFIDLLTAIEDLEGILGRVQRIT